MGITYCSLITILYNHVLTEKDRSRGGGGGGEGEGDNGEEGWRDGGGGCTGRPVRSLGAED